jgi:hypothetical protein
LAELEGKGFAEVLLQVSSLDREDIKPDIVHLVGGVNDIWHNLPKPSYFATGRNNPRDQLMLDMSKNKVER